MMYKSLCWYKKKSCFLQHLDQIELASIDQVLRDENNNGNLYVGAIKNNLGHTEAASSFVSLSKAIITLNSEVIPPNRCFQPNKRIKVANSLEVRG